MTAATGQEPTTDRAPTRKLTGGQIWVLVIATIPMIAVGIGGAIGTYANAASVLHRAETALGVVAAGEGATLVAALVMIGVTMLGQSAPFVVRASLWLLPATASFMGLVIAPTAKEAVVYGLTPLAMTASAEGLSFLARRIVAHTSGVDVEAQRRNAETMRQIAYHAARSERHPDEKVRAKSSLTAWKLMSQIGSGDAQLGSGLISVQRERLTEGADTALVAMLTGPGETAHAMSAAPVSRALEPGETTPETTREPTSGSAALPSRPEPGHTPHRQNLADPATLTHPSDQHLRREPVLSPSEPTLTKTVQAEAETATDETGEPEPGADEIEQQITTLAQLIQQGERLTKTTAAHALGVSPATAGRRLKEARGRISDGTGLYM